MDEKIQKVLARAGYGSRREIETWIEQGRIKVNRHVAKLGDRITLEDFVQLDDKPLTRQTKTVSNRVIAYHKPVGEICSRNDPEGRPTIFKNLPEVHNSRWITVGRLDYNTSGLILLTTDGELANKLMHPSQEVEREYAVRVLGQVSDETLTKLQQGVELEDGMASFDRILDSGGQGSNHWYHVLLKEGRNREVRRLWEAVGHTVSRLSRIRYGNIELGRQLKSGHTVEIQQTELKKLYELAGLKLPESVVIKKKSVYSKKGYQKKSATKNKWGRRS